MLRLLKELFGGGEASRGEAKSQAARSQSVSVSGDKFYGANIDIIDGLQFSATLQLRTPLSVLIHHGEVFNGPPSQAPDYGGEGHGIWLPRVSGTFEILSEGRTHASDAGPVNDKEYVPFLKAFRTLVEGPGTELEKLRAMREIPEVSPSFASFWRKLQRNVEGFPESFFYMQLTAIDGIGRTTAQRLFEAGFRSVNQVRSAPPDALVAVKGVGKGLAAKMKSEVAPPSS